MFHPIRRSDFRCIPLYTMDNSRVFSEMLLINIPSIPSTYLVFAFMLVPYI